MDENNEQNNVVGKLPEHPNLNAGGTPGNKGGTGRPKSQVREACKDAFDSRLDVLSAIADNPESTPTERMKALDLLGKYGGLQQIDNTSGDEPIKPATILDLKGMSVDERLSLLEKLPE